MTNPAYAPATSNKKTLAILSLVFGIVSIVLCLFLPILWILLAIAGVILGFLSRSREPAGRTIALVGIILSFVGIAANILSMVIGAIAAVSYLRG
ncbi:DUF4190 domain-containing protein [Herbiconiux sp. YIM B11900]|uniref:DUF4190 domain-containing protein n=1 Tax=Herbiconiux sp. YIM B11900 TaxID=3404131 RepID=UPI003F83C742